MVFKEIFEQARQARQKNRLRRKQEKKQVKISHDQALALAKQEKPAVEAECRQQLKTAQELLQSISAQELLQSIKKDVWGCGKIKSFPGKSSVNIQKSPPPYNKPFTYYRSYTWPDIELAFQNNIVKYRKYLPVLHYSKTGPFYGEYQTETTRRPVTSSLRISTTSSPNELIISRFNKITPSISGHVSRFNFYTPNYKNLVSLFNRKSPCQLSLYPPPPPPINNIVKAHTREEALRGWQEPEYKEYKPEGISIKGSTPDLQKTITDVLQTISLNEFHNEQLPQDFYQRVKKAAR